MAEYLFAYGTLQPGMASADIAPVVYQLRPVGEGFVRGVLYDLGEYPGALLDPAAEERISGTVFELPSDTDILRQLDDYEGFNENSADESLFIRILRPVVLANGETLNCWIYAYNGKPKSSRVVTSGRFEKR